MKQVLTGWSNLLWDLSSSPLWVVVTTTCFNFVALEDVSCPVAWRTLTDWAASQRPACSHPCVYCSLAGLHYPTLARVYLLTLARMYFPKLARMYFPRLAWMYFPTLARMYFFTLSTLYFPTLARLLYSVLATLYYPTVARLYYPTLATLYHSIHAMAVLARTCHAILAWTFQLSNLC